MEYQNSTVVDPQDVEKLIPTRLAVRKSKYHEMADHAIQIFAQEWEEAGGGGFQGCLAPKGSIISMGLPEMEPDRVAVITKLTEFFFAADDMSSQPGPEEVYSKIMLGMLRIDPVRGKLLADAVDRYRTWFSGHQATKFESWDDWLSYRWEDGDCYMYLMVIIYGCKLDLTRPGLEPIWNIAWKGMALTTLSNDLYSFDIESICELQDTGQLRNGVWRLMEERDITAKEAKEALLTEKMKPLEDQFIAEKAAFQRDHGETSPRLAHYLQLVEFMVSGNWYWGSNCYRYHNWREVRPWLADSKLDESTAKCDAYLEAAAAARAAKLIPPKIEEEPLDRFLDLKTTVREHPSPLLNDEHVSGPVNYLESLPSKNVRGLIVEALSSWFKVPQATLDNIESIVCHLHSASLLLDDIEDQSPRRRGHPSPYKIFGPAQTINSANFVYVAAVEDLLKLTKRSQEIFLEQMKKLHIGQSYDIYWARSCTCPSEEEYLEMCRMKTGGLFCMLGGMIYAEAELPKPVDPDDLSAFFLLLGQFFQIRDDYINLASAAYEKEKGFAEDLDEGKHSFPLIHLLQNSPDHLMIRNILQQRSQDGQMPMELKTLVLQKMNEARSLDYVRKTIHSLETQAKDALGVLEKQAGQKNYMLRYLIARLAHF
ncbi:Geranylgeranyl pyrophosphate synthase [Aspergillus nanangensis]|uniref:Geranylgeranyl pyrophosphate synthase n=1 Tax=Aspergillus nanangensis TaxID=2582783 RepID=A0AAD4CU65_ASPNN|nr:Geranylgeranyl pyrophosphate synthase [Aspergillus nanangensis]